MFEISQSVVIILIFPVRIKEFEFKPLPEKKIFPVLQNDLLPDTFLTFKLLKHSLFVSSNRLTQKILCFLYLPQFILDLVSLNLF